MPPPPSETVTLLRRWHGGDRAALDQLLERDLPWIRRRVRDRLGNRLRQRVQSGDVVQEALLTILQYVPDFVISNRNHFRALLAQIVESVLCNQSDWFSAKRRELDRERPLPDDHVLNLDPPLDRVEPPSETAARNDEIARMRLVFELLHVEDRKLLWMRRRDELSFADIAHQLGCCESTARDRLNRATRRFLNKMAALRHARFDELLDQENPPASNTTAC